MDKRGITFFYTLMLGTTIIVLALALATPVKQFVDDSRNNDFLNCTNNDTLSDYDNATCIGLDLLMPLFIGGLLFIGGGIIGAKIIFGG